MPAATLRFDGAKEEGGGPSHLEQSIVEFDLWGSTTDPDCVAAFASRAMPGYEGLSRLWVAMILEHIEAVQLTPMIRQVSRGSKESQYQAKTLRERLNDGLEFFFEEPTNKDGLSLVWLCNAIHVVCRVRIDPEAVRRYAALMYQASLSDVAARKRHKWGLGKGAHANVMARSRMLEKIYKARREAEQRIAS